MSIGVGLVGREVSGERNVLLVVVVVCVLVEGVVVLCWLLSADPWPTVRGWVAGVA